MSTTQLLRALVRRDLPTAYVDAVLTELASRIDHPNEIDLREQPAAVAKVDTRRAEEMA